MRTHLIKLLVLVVFFPFKAFAQVPITSFNTANSVTVAGGTYTRSITSHPLSYSNVIPNRVYNVSYNNISNVSLTHFDVAGKPFVPFDDFDTVITRRVANAGEPTNGNKQQIFCQGDATVDNVGYNIPLPVAYPEVTGHAYMERVIKEGFINRGADNIFANQGDVTINNIERIDIFNSTPYKTTELTSAGFVVTDRGGNDAFKIAAITSIDAAKNPTAFSNVISVSAATFTAGAALWTGTTFIMRKDVADDTLRPFRDFGSQSVKGVFVRFSDLGIAANQNVYGYALMAPDVTAVTSAELLDYTNSLIYPTTTPNNIGGLDLASAPGIFHTDFVLPVQFSSFTATKNNRGLTLNFSDEDHKQVVKYQLEKSLDGVNFNKLVSIYATEDQSAYSYTDNAFNKSCYYRIKVKNLSGSYYFSTSLFAKFTAPVVKLDVYPNPAHNNLAISFQDDLSASQVSIIAMNGKEYQRVSVTDNTRLLQMDISALPSGHYFLNVTAKNGGVITYSFAKQ